MNRNPFRQRPIVLALASTLALASAQAIAQDVEIRTPAAGNFAVRNSTGAILHLLVNDFSGEGGAGEVCCWTNALVKVIVTR